MDGETTSSVSSLPPTAPACCRAALAWLPNLLVFLALAAVMVIGHRSGWKVPRMSQLMGHVAATSDDWCAEHLVPESDCIECNVELVAPASSLGFCREHGVAECVNHHPELAQVDGTPQLPAYDTVAAIDLMERPANNSRNTLHRRRVQLASTDSIAKAGIEVDVVAERPMQDRITANGELMFDPTRVGHLGPRVSGTVALVLKTIGDAVEAGDILAVVDSSQVGQAKSQLLQAVVQRQWRAATVERLRPVSTSGAVPQKALVEAEAALREAEVAVISARQALVNLGFELPDDLDNADPESLSDELLMLGIPQSVVQLLPPGTKTANLIPLRAPFRGVVIDLEVAAGEMVDASKELFTISDPTRLWLVLHVRQEDAKYVRPGLPVEFSSDNGDQAVSGQVEWINPAVDHQTRTVEVRVAVANSDGSLRGNTFGTGHVVLRDEPRAVVVPREAVQSTTDARFVFVRDKRYFDEWSPKFFHVRQVRTGATDGQYVEILAGALPGEVIATTGSNVLMAQLLRSQLGAGCGCHED